jgi:hypothetical protein
VESDPALWKFTEPAFDFRTDDTDVTFELLRGERQRQCDRDCERGPGHPV